MNPNLLSDCTQGFWGSYSDLKELGNSGGFSLKSIFQGEWRLFTGLCLALCMIHVSVDAQTDFAPGEIMFTGYNSDAPDGFSFVLLTDVVSGTVIAIADRGWSNNTGFRLDNTGEGTIELTFNAAYPCGTEVIFTDSEDANDWDNPINQNGVVIGTVVIVAGGGANGPELGTTGDQLFIYQNPVPTAGSQGNFITAIHMDGAWAGGPTSDDSSAKPNGLDDGEVVLFNTEVDNAKYDCDPKVGTSSFLQSAITNNNSAGWLKPDGSNNWIENDITNINLNVPCNFCCSSTILTGPDIVSGSQMFTITITGSLPPGESWQLYTAGCGVGSPLQTTMGNSFMITAPSMEGSITYYIRASGATECPGLCVYHSVCVENTPLATCTSCTGNPDVCGDCLLPDIASNPDLDSGCYEISLIFILDESGSIFFPTNYADSVENGVMGFLNALNGQDIQMALIEFGSTASLVTNYTTINNTLINQMQNYFDGGALNFNGFNYNSSGGTNWHRAMFIADTLDPADIIFFFTDGIPTVWNVTGQDCGNGATTQTPEIVNPVKLANSLKNEGAHMFMLGVGSGINEDNLELMSGPDEYDPGVNTIGTSDFSIGNFGDLSEDLEEFVNELCVTPLELDKQVFGAVCDGFQQFMFIIHNPGTESAATVIEVKDTFPSGYTNIMYNGSPFVKVCIGMGCWAQGYIAPDNAFLWTTNAIPPGESDTLIISAQVLPSGNYTNVAWAKGSNTLLIRDEVTSPNFVDDLTPTIMCPPNVTIACNDSTLPSDTGVPTANDPDGTTPDLEYTDMIQGSGCPQDLTITRTWTATDGCQNSAMCVQTIVVHDITPPELDCPANITIDCAESTLPSNTGNATASDDCDHMLTINFSDVTMEGGCAQGYIILRTWITEDDCGNENSCTQIITLGDNQAPSITCPANVTIQCTASTLPANTGSATATDFCSTISITSTDVIVPLACSQNRIITRTWHATDACNNASTCNQTITIIDNVAPNITCPANVTISCTSSTLPATTGNPTATDNCSTFTFSFSNVITAGSCPQERTITRTWQVTDACGNSNICNQTITVDDSAAPVLTCPANITIACTSSTLPSNTGTATAVDNCSTFIITSSDMMIGGSCPQEKTIIRTWLATDACGNAGTCNQTITIEDNVSPVIICPIDVTIECDDSTTPGSTGMATSTDNCDNAPVFMYNDVTVEGSCPQAYSITRTWISTDACSNSSTCVQIISVEDNTPPVIVCPPNVTIECLDNTLPAQNGSATATDNCDVAPEITYSDVTISGPTSFGHTILRTWLATDHCGNNSTCLQTIIVENPLVPAITGMSTDTICSGDAVTFQAQDQGMATYQWNFGSGSSPGTASGIGPHTVHYTYNATNGSIGANVILTVILPGCLSASDTVANIHVNPIPNPAIMAPTNALCYFRNRTFKPVAAQIPGYLYHWNFGEGASIPSITGYGPHLVSYSTTGTKTVQLIVVSNTPGAFCSDTATISINVVACPGSIFGKVRRQDGTGIASANVRLFTDVNLDGLPEGLPVRDLFTSPISPIGIFAMTNLVPGQYVLVEIQPEGYYSLSDGDETNDFDTLVYTVPDDDIIPVTIEPQEIDSNNVFVEIPSPGIINGYVYNDLDNDVTPDVGEGIDGVMVNLWRDVDVNGIADPGGFLSSTLTNAIGWYEFGDLGIGSYVLLEDQPAGYESSSDVDPSNDGDAVLNSNTHNDIIPVTVTLNETDADNYFIETQVCGTQVTNTNDDGPGSLRYVINCVSDGATITFHPFLQNQIIHLQSGRIEINKNLFIHCGLTPRVKVNSDVPGAFLIDAGITVEFMNLDITSGLSGFPGAAIENYGHSILWDMNIFRNVLLQPGNYLIYNSSPGLITVKGGIQIDNN